MVLVRYLWRRTLLEVKIIIIIIIIMSVKTKVIPVIVGATGTISESFRQYLSNILAKHRI